MTIQKNSYIIDCKDIDVLIFIIYKNMRNVKKIVYIAIFSALIAICSLIQIPYVVPFTLQTFAVFLTLLCLGGKSGTIAILVYIFLGAIGFPVFSGFRSGVGGLMSPTGGYIIGFVVQGFIYIIFELFHFKYRDIISLVVGLAVLYILGTVWFVFVATNNNNDIGFTEAMLSCVIPFILPDVAKMVVAILIHRRLDRSKVLKKLSI